MEEEIIIDLNETHTKSFNSGGLIQINTKRKFFELIKKLIDEIKETKKDQYSKNSFPRAHNTILINGKRGVGKTSFILSMMDALSDKDSHPEIYKLNLCILDSIDPTLIETAVFQIMFPAVSQLCFHFCKQVSRV